MSISIYIKFFKILRNYAFRLIQVIMLCLWFANLLTCSLIYQNTYTLSSRSDIPLHTLIDYDLTSPEKLYNFQNETKRITENLKVQPLFNLNLAILSMTDLHYKSLYAILKIDETTVLSYVFIETKNPRSPPFSFI